MRARQITAFIHRSRVADVVNALRTAGFRNVTLLDTRLLSEVFEAKGRDHSLSTGNGASPTVKLEVICDNESKTAHDDRDSGMQPGTVGFHRVTVRKLCLSCHVPAYRTRTDSLRRAWE